MRRVSGGLGFVSERVGVHRHAVTACIAGLVVLLAGCSNTAAEPTVIEVRCNQLNEPVYAPDLLPSAILLYVYAVETYYWSDGSKTTKHLPHNCP